MNDKEKVIEGLQCCSVKGMCTCELQGCPYYPDKYNPCNECTNQLTAGALAMLKERAVRVLALDEIKEGEPYWFQMWHRLPTRAVICVYREDDTQKPYVTFTWQFGTFSWESEDYNKSWRCWTAKPTDEQIEAVKWDD